jgi:hypothetical protein
VIVLLIVADTPGRLVPGGSRANRINLLKVPGKIFRDNVKRHYSKFDVAALAKPA